MVIYYSITILANIVAAIAFFESINITALSVIPLALIVLMIFQSLFLKNEKVENGFRTNFGSNFSGEEENGLLSSTSRFLLWVIPFMFPFIIFFSSPIKALSVLVYVIGLIGGAALYRIKNKGKISDRMNDEEIERKEQERKEELGKWK